MSISNVMNIFRRAARTYDAAAFLQREVADRLLERLDYIKIDPNIVLDLGAGTGYATEMLSNRYKKAKIIAFDISTEMLQVANQDKRWLDTRRYVCGRAEKLPFADQSIDMVFSNLMLHWSPNTEHVLSEIRRVLTPHGLLLFSIFGPDTLYEMRQSRVGAENFKAISHFIDMHFVGDFLQKLKFQDAVVDMEFITIKYNELRKILQDLKEAGTHHLIGDSPKGLVGKDRFEKFVTAYEQFRNPEGNLPVTYEIIYGIGWRAEYIENQGEYSIPISQIKKANDDTR